jgi:hypothetical protein
MKLGARLCQVADPYQILGVSPRVSDAELRAAYRKLVRLHHPDHNGGSLESARRFEAVQEAYTQALAQRRRQATPSPGPGASPSRADPVVDARLADLERELRQAQGERERARRLAQQAARAAAAEHAAAMARGEIRDRPSDEELGYYDTDDSFSKIFADAASELSERLSEAGHDHRVPKPISELIDELGSKLTGNPPEGDK